VLCNRLAPGDILVMTNCIRDLKTALPEYEIEVRTPANEIFENNPYVTKLSYSEDEYNTAHKAFVSNAAPDREHRVKMLDNGVLCIDMQYPCIHGSGQSGDHFCQGHGKFLADMLGIDIPQKVLSPEIYLSETEKTWASQVFAAFEWKDPYWVINAGSKSDYTLKQYHRYQEVVDLLKDKVKFVQIGQTQHSHEALNGAFDLRGKTTLRQLFRLIHRAHGVLTCVSLPMHVAAAFQKPCVVVAGAREGTRWELYPNHQFLYVNGCLPCATYDGCWKSKTPDCVNLEEGIPLCLKMITPEDIVRSIERYYEGRMLSYAHITREKVANCL
jgi:ADP-heptose:LPS heptosyltransferase